MFALISVLFIGVGLYFGGDRMPWCFIASGLFAIASAIDGLNLTIVDEKDDQ